MSRPAAAEAPTSDLTKRKRLPALYNLKANRLLARELAIVGVSRQEKGPPSSFEADAVRDEKVKVLKSIRPMALEEVLQRTVRGQYGPGELGGCVAVDDGIF